MSTSNLRSGDQSESLGTALARNIGLLSTSLVLIVQIGGAVWFAADENARVSETEKQIALMQSRNLPTRVQVMEDSTKSMQQDISTLQAEYREITSGMNDQSQRLATIQAQLGFLIGQVVPNPTGASATTVRPRR